MLKVSETNLFATYVKNLSIPTLILFIPPLIVIRSIISLFYLPISYKITLAKFEGMGIFLKRWFSGHYVSAREFSNTIRVRSDFEVLSNNQNSIFSINPILYALRDWLPCQEPK